MRINVELIAVRSPLVGAGGALDVDDGVTVAQVLERLSLPNGESYMTIVNGTSIRPDNRDDAALNDGDAVTVFPPIKGG